MKKLFSALCMLCTAALPLFGGEETPLGEKDFQLGEFTVNGGKVKVTHDKGVFTVEIPEQPGISNETRGAIFKLPLKNLLGKGLQIRGEVRYENIAFDRGNQHSGGKILAYNGKVGVKNFFGSPTLKGSRNEWQPVTLYCNFPADIDDAQIVFGIQQGWGKLQFRNITIEEFPIVEVNRWRNRKSLLRTLIRERNGSEKSWFLQGNACQGNSSKLQSLIAGVRRTFTGMQN